MYSHFYSQRRVDLVDPPLGYSVVADHNSSCYRLVRFGKTVAKIVYGRGQYRIKNVLDAYGYDLQEAVNLAADLHKRGEIYN